MCVQNMTGVQSSQLVQVDGCIRVKPVRLRMRLGREHLLVRIKVHLQRISVWFLFEKKVTTTGIECVSKKREKRNFSVTEIDTLRSRNARA